MKLTYYSSTSYRMNFHSDDPLVVHSWCAKTRARHRKFNPLSEFSAVTVIGHGQWVTQAYIKMRRAGIRPDDAREMICGIVCAGNLGRGESGLRAIPLREAVTA